MEREFNKDCLQCPFANKENPEAFARAAGRILTCLEEMPVTGSAEGKILMELIEHVEESAPTCDSGPRGVIVTGARKPDTQAVCGKMAGVVLIGKYGVQELRFDGEKNV